MEPEAVGSAGSRCPACAAPVEGDWLTCRSCGAILAAIRRSPQAATPAASPAWPPAAPAPEAPAAEPPPAARSPDWPSSPALPSEPPPPSTPPVHTAAIAPTVLPAASRELGPNEWYSARAEPAASEPAESATVGATPPAPVEPVPGRPLPVAPSTTTPPRPSIFADLPLAIPESGGGRVAALGLLLVAVAFFLPWSPLLPGISYFDAWGFSRASRLFVFAADLVLLVLTVQPVGLSTRVRTGWLPLAFGVFVVGVFWERVDSLSVVGVGAWLFAIGGLLSAVGGVLALASRESSASEHEPTAAE